MPVDPQPPDQPVDRSVERPRSPAGRLVRWVTGHRKRALLLATIPVAVLLAAAGLAGSGNGNGADGPGARGGGDGGAASSPPGAEDPTTSTTVAGTAGTPASTTTTTPAAPDGGGAGDAGDASGAGDAGPPAPTLGDVVLTAEGLGVVDFGAPAGEVLAALTAALGPPDEDTGPTDASQTQVLGACPAGGQRAVRWGQLTVGLLDGASTYASRATEHFMMFSYDGPAPPLATDGGVTIGATVDEVRQAYGDAVEVVQGDELVEPRVRADLDAPHPLVLVTPDQRVTSIRAGEPCG